MMCRIAATTDYVLLSSLSACAMAINARGLVVLPFIDPAINVVFAILRLEARTLPHSADQLIRHVIAADRTTLETERKLTARLLKPDSKFLPVRRRAVAVSASSPAKVRARG
jgi:hypothetical protein